MSLHTFFPTLIVANLHHCHLFGLRWNTDPLMGEILDELGWRTTRPVEEMVGLFRLRPGVLLPCLVVSMTRGLL